MFYFQFKKYLNCVTLKTSVKHSILHSVAFPKELNKYEKQK